MEDQDRNFSITAFLVGSILGASASLLFTPKSGHEIRAGIRSQINSYLTDVKSRTDDLIQNSKSAGELLKRKAEDVMETVKQYALGKANKPISAIEKEIAGMKAAINAAKASYSVTSEINKANNDGDNGQSLLREFEEEILPKHIGMGKGRNRKSYYS